MIVGKCPKFNKNRIKNWTCWSVDVLGPLEETTQMAISKRVLSSLWRRNRQQKKNKIQRRR